MRRAVRAIIIRDNTLLVMHRNKFGTEYDTLPGGNIELHETPEEALHRELKEETGVEFANPRLVIAEHAGHPWGDQLVYLCDYVSGEPVLHPDSEEAHIHILGQNLYAPAWLSIDDLASRPFKSEPLKELLIQYSKSGWPETAVEITTS